MEVIEFMQMFYLLQKKLLKYFPVATLTMVR